MGRILVKQPNGRYAFWSTIVDAIVVYNMTAEQVEKEVIKGAIEDAKALAVRFIEFAEKEQWYDYQEHERGYAWEQAKKTMNSPDYKEDDKEQWEEMQEVMESCEQMIELEVKE